MQNGLRCIDKFFASFLQMVLEAEMDRAKIQSGIVGSEFTKSHGPDRSASSLSNKSNFNVSNSVKTKIAA